MNLLLQERIQVLQNDKVRYFFVNTPDSSACGQGKRTSASCLSGDVGEVVIVAEGFIRSSGRMWRP
jgi:hypothetical protein